MKNNTVLITGASGFLGSALTCSLSVNGYDVKTHGRSQNVDFVADLTSFEETFKLIKLVKPNVIINLVALTDVDQCEVDLQTAYSTNCKTVENLSYVIQLTESRPYLIHLSTDHVYDHLDLNDEGDVKIINNYAMTKYAGEIAAMSVPSAVIRTNFFGRSNRIERVGFTDWLYHSLCESKPISAFDDIFFSPLSINTLIYMIELVIQKRPLACFNIGSHGGMSKADFIYKFAANLGASNESCAKITTTKSTFVTAPRPKNMLMNVQKFESLMGVELPTLSDEIMRVAKEYNNHA